MPDGHERFKQTTAGCHTSALGELFIPDECGKAQGGIYKMIEFTNLVLRVELEVEIDFNGATPSPQMEYSRLFMFYGADT
jgi:hypothetical protein